MLVDNITYQNQRGQITNLANDGSKNDVLIAPPHPASQEWSGVAANAVVIYALDTPVMTDKLATEALNIGTSALLSTLFTASDPTGRAVTKYQAYNTNAADNLLLGKVVENANSAASAVTATSLASMSLLASLGLTTDTLEVRGYNGTYWGDWQSLAVNVVVQPPVLVAQTAAQNWLQGQKVNFALPSTVFSDPQHQVLSYAATGAGGAGLPAWLSFNSITRAFTGTVPAGLENFPVVVTATDTAGLSNSETFVVNVAAAAPLVALHTAAQSWAAGGAISFALPSGTFTDPQGQALTYTVVQANGSALPTWLHFDPVALAFSGAAPTALQTLQLKVTATDTSHLSVYEVFTATIVKGAAGLVVGDWNGSGPGAGAHDAAVLPAEERFGGPSGWFWIRAPRDADNAGCASSCVMGTGSGGCGYGRKARALPWTRWGRHARACCARRPQTPIH
ncbi:MAG: putative Ig domain-containing protein [Rhodospirillales bacterium]